MGKPLIHSMPDSGTLQRTVLDQFRRVGNRGATVDEIAEAIKILHQRVSPMVSRLKELGFIGPKGQAKRDSVCGSPMTVYVLVPSFVEELVSAGYYVRFICQCTRSCSSHGDGIIMCDADATEELDTYTMGKVLLCLECAVEVPSGNVRASRSLGDKLK